MLHIVVTTRLFNVNFNLLEGVSKRDIEKIPIYRYKAMTTPDEDNSSDNSSPKITHNDNVTSTTSTSIEEDDKKRKSSFFKKKPQTKDDDKHYDYFTIPKPEDALCTICLCEYEDDELICKLW